MSALSPKSEILAASGCPFAQQPSSPARSNTLQHVPPQRQRQKRSRNADAHQERNERRIETVLDRHDGSSDHRSHRRFEQRDLHDIEQRPRWLSGSFSRRDRRRADGQQDSGIAGQAIRLGRALIYPRNGVRNV
jgi:hypothetical protein